MGKSLLQIFSIPFFVLILDQLTKYWVRSSLTLGESLPVLGRDFFRLTHVENTGVAFGLQPLGMWFLIAFNAVASGVLIYVLLKSLNAGLARYPRLVEFSLALILGGALGNLVDRVVFRQVTDFLDFDFPNFIMERWPVFNVADSAVTIGVTLWCVYLVFFGKTRSAPDTRINSGARSPQSG